MREVYKFGGTSVDCLDQIVNVIQSGLSHRPYVCVSAFSGITNELLNCIKQADEGKKPNLENILAIHLQKIVTGVKNQHAKELLQTAFQAFFQKRLPKLQEALAHIAEEGVNTLDHDRIMGFGEQASAFVIAELLTLELKNNGKKGKFVDLGEIVKNGFQQANSVFQKALRENLSEELLKVQDDEIAIITGFFGEVPGGILYSIDRGYTDFTGAIVASVLQAKRFVIFKEVDGVCSTDPRIVKDDCLLLRELSYVEVLKMASAGMKAINTEAVRPAMKANIPIEVRNTFTPEIEGTKIVAKRPHHPDRKIQNIAIKKEVCIVRFGGFTDANDENLERKLAELLEKHAIKKFFLTSDYAGTSVTLPYDAKKIEMLMDDLRLFGNVKLNKNCAIVAIIGEEMAGVPGILATATKAIFDAGVSIEMVAQGASEIGIDFVIKEEFVNTVVENIHKAFFAPQTVIASEA